MSREMRHRWPSVVDAGSADLTLPGKGDQRREMGAIEGYGYATSL